MSNTNREAPMPIRFTNCIRAVAELALPEDMYDLTDEKRVSICVVMHRADQVRRGFIPGFDRNQVTDLGAPKPR
jgi:hypothetical protein